MQCEQVYYQVQFPPRWLPRWLRHKIFMARRLPRKKITCPNEATVTLDRPDCEYPNLNGPINVCADHVKDVEISNYVRELQNSGELDRMICEAEGCHQDGTEGHDDAV